MCSLRSLVWRVAAASPCLISLQVALAGLHCAQLLTGANLVHRDLRLANFFWDMDDSFVGDLELAAKAPLQVPLQLCSLMRQNLQLGL